MDTQKEGFSRRFWIFRRLGINLAVFVLIPLAVSLPFRVLNKIRHDTWMMNKMEGMNTGWYTWDMEVYDKSNGPASNQLYEWCKTIREHTPEFAKEPEDITRGLFAAADHVLNGEHRLIPGSPRLICYAMTRNWIKTDDFMFQIFFEAIKKDIPQYIRWGFQNFRWYLAGISENPNEFQFSFHRDQMEIIRISSLPLRSVTIVTEPLVGIVNRYPAVFNVYNVFRLRYAKSMTYLKKNNSSLHAIAAVDHA